MLLAFVGLLFLFIFMNLPVAFALLAASIIYLHLLGRYPLLLVIQRMFDGVDTFALLAIPLFILAGMLMEEGEVSDRIVKFSSALLARFTGGFGIASTFASMIFAAISGSGPASTAAIGSITMPAMIRHGYGREWTTAFQAAAGALGPIIPPSITMIIYGAIAGVSISALFLGGFVPGILIGLGLMVLIVYRARKLNLRESEPMGRHELWRSFKEASWALGMPFIILGGIFSGVFTPTEAAAAAVLYGFVISVFVYRTLPVARIPRVLTRSAVTTGTVMILVGTASVFSWILTAERGPQLLLGLLSGVSDNPLVIVFLVNVMLMILGLFLETSSALIMLAPILVPLMQSLGFDLVHFGVVMTVNLAIGMVTPPLGLTLFVACNISRTSISEVVRPMFGIVGMMIAVLMLITYVPDLVLFLPRAVLGR